MLSESLLNRVKKIGMPAGSLVHLGKSASTPTEITLIEYTPHSLVVRDDADLGECRQCIDAPSNTWIHICGIHDATMMERLGTEFGLHPLVMEDILNTSQRTKLDAYQQQLFFILRSLSRDLHTQQLRDEQISLILGPTYLLSFAERPLDFFTPLRQRLTRTTSRIRTHNVDYLCYALIDTIVDHQFVALQQIDEEIVNIEEELLVKTSPRTLHTIQKIKRDITLAHKAIWPLRDMISQLIRDDSPLITNSTKVYFHDVSDHVMQAIDSTETFRDISVGLVDLYVSYTSQKLNEIMKVLTIVSTLFVPLTFITSLYGMNFVHMPGLEWKSGFTLVILAMLLTAAIMLTFFRRRHWI